MDLFVWLISPFKTLHPTFTFFRIANAGSVRYFSVEKAKRVLGYAPTVPLAEGAARRLALRAIAAATIDFAAAGMYRSLEFFWPERNPNAGLGETPPQRESVLTRRRDQRGGSDADAGDECVRGLRPVPAADGIRRTRSLAAVHDAARPE